MIFIWFPFNTVVLFASTHIHIHSTRLNYVYCLLVIIYCLLIIIYLTRML